MIRRLLAPSLVVAVVLGVKIFLGADWLADPRVLHILRAVVVVVFVLAWRLRRGRVAWALVAVWGVAEASLAVGAFKGESAPVVVVALAAAVLLPLHLAVAAVGSEWWVASRGGLIRFGWLGGVGAVLAGVTSEAGSPIFQILTSALKALRARIGSLAGGFTWPEVLGPDNPLDAYAVPSLRFAAFVGAAVVIAWALRRRRSPLDAGLLVVLVVVYLATLNSELTLLCYGTAVLVLAVSLVENAARLAFDDGLTGLPARRALEESLDQLGGVYSLAMVDIDHFKRLNDRHGHEVGDQVLRKVAARLAAVRGGRAFRYGGEEFTLLFPGLSAQEAESRADEVRLAVAGEPFTVRSPGRPKRSTKGKAQRGRGGAGGGEKSLKVTVSVGVAERSDKRPTPEEVLKAADRALYRSKKNGRNRTTVGK